MIAYLAGPMTGYPQFNFPAFELAAQRLRESGTEVISPAELDDERTRHAAANSPDGDLAAFELVTDEAWGTLIGRDVALVADKVDAVVVLPGWEESRGAKIEVFTAMMCGKAVYAYGRWDEDWEGTRGKYRPQIDTGFDEDYMLDEHEIRAHLGMPADRGAVKAAPVARAEDVMLHGQYISFDDDPDIDADGMPFNQNTGEVRITSATGGQKGQKPERMDLIPPEFVEELARVYGGGAEKYDDWNWLKGYDWSLSYGALMRHLYRWLAGEDIDPESGRHHLAHVAWHCATLFTFQQHHLGTDTRVGDVIQQAKDRQANQ